MTVIAVLILTMMFIPVFLYLGSLILAALIVQSKAVFWIMLMALLTTCTIYGALLHWIIS